MEDTITEDIIKLLKNDHSRVLALKLLKESSNKVLYYMLLDSKELLEIN